MLRNLFDEGRTESKGSLDCEVRSVKSNVCLIRKKCDLSKFPDN